MTRSEGDEREGKAWLARRRLAPLLQGGRRLRRGAAGVQGRQRARAIKIGQFLSPLVGREVPIQAGGKTGKAVLRVEPGRSKERRYYAVVTWDEEKQEAPDGEGEPRKKSRNKGKARKRAKEGGDAGKQGAGKGTRKRGKEGAKKKPTASGGHDAVPGMDRKSTTEKVPNKAAGNEETWG